MKSTSVIRTLSAICFTMSFASFNASADDFDCFPQCEATKITTLTEATISTSCPAKSNAPSPTQATVEKIEHLNSQLKPVKEIAGYIQSPQGLAVKLVNDHIVKIPAWVGYAIDPVSALKNKAMNEVRDRAKTALKEEFSKSSDAACVVTTETVDTVKLPSVEKVENAV